MNEDKRTEFNKLRKQWMKEHGWKGFVCARCGHFSKSAHLHHIKELVYGGENDPKNLIPLCSQCHRELDVYSKDFPFEHFLVTMPGVILPVTHEISMFDGAEMLSTRTLLSLCTSVYRSANLAKTSHLLEEMDVLASDLLCEQNEFFSQYPYSDEDWRTRQMKQVYGELTPGHFIRTNSCRA